MLAAVESTAFDRVDREILGVLQTDGRITYQQLAQRVRLSPNATAERVRKLVGTGVITGFQAVVDPAALGRGLEALIEVRLERRTDPGEFEAALGRMPATLEALHTTGPADYLVRVACRDTRELDTLVRMLKARFGVSQTETRIVLGHVPVDPLLTS